MVVVKVFKGPSLLLYAFEGSYKSEHLLIPEESTGKFYKFYKFFLAALNPNSHFFGSSVSGCSSNCPQQGLCRQLSLLSVTPAGPLKGQCSVPPTLHRSYPLCKHQPQSCLGRSLRVWSGKTFLHNVFNCPLIWVYCNVLRILKTILEALNS